MYHANFYWLFYFQESRMNKKKIVKISAVIILAIIVIVGIIALILIFSGDSDSDEKEEIYKRFDFLQLSPIILINSNNLQFSGQYGDTNANKISVRKLIYPKFKLALDLKFVAYFAVEK